MQPAKATQTALVLTGSRSVACLRSRVTRRVVTRWHKLRTQPARRASAKSAHRTCADAIALARFARVRRGRRSGQAPFAVMPSRARTGRGHDRRLQPGAVALLVLAAAAA